MKYKGYLIEPVYTAGTDFRITKDGRVIDRKPTKNDIDYYDVVDPMDNFRKAWGDATIADAKKSIDELLAKINMKSNARSEWEKLDGYD